IGTSGGPLQPPAGQTTADREYRVIPVDDNTIKLGTTFGAGPADTGSLVTPGVGGDGPRGVVRFARPPQLLPAHSVQYDPGTNASIGGAGLTTAGVYLVQKIDEFTIRLFATQAEALAAAQAFNPAASGVVASNKITVSGPGFANGTRVTYREPAPVGF